MSDYYRILYTKKQDQKENKYANMILYIFNKIKFRGIEIIKYMV